MQKFDLQNTYNTLGGIIGKAISRFFQTCAMFGNFLEVLELSMLVSSVPLIKIELLGILNVIYLKKNHSENTLNITNI